MINNRTKLTNILSVLLVFILSIVSYYGAFVEDTYSRDTVSMAAQGVGQDIVDLFFVVPLLIITLFLTNKGNLKALLFLAGAVFYVLYSFVIYSLGVHFNSLFLHYCAVLGLSLYTFLLVMNRLISLNISNYFNDHVPRRTIAGFLIFVAIMFYLLWFKDVVPAVWNNSVPATVSDYNLLVNPVHVLDISIVLPGLIVAAVLLLKKQSLGYILSTIGLVFTIILTIALIGMVIMLQVRGIGEDISLVWIFGLLSIVSAILLFLLLKNLTAIGKKT